MPCRNRFHALARQPAAQEICPKNSRRCCVLGEAADAPQFTGEARNGSSLRSAPVFWNVPEVLALALGIIRDRPPAIIEHAPECIAVNHGQIGDDGDDKCPPRLRREAARQMVMIDHEWRWSARGPRGSCVCPENSPCFIFLCFRQCSRKRCAFLTSLIPTRHLGWMQREDRNRLKDRFTRIRP